METIIHWLERKYGAHDLTFENSKNVLEIKFLDQDEECNICRFYHHDGMAFVYKLHDMCSYGNMKNYRGGSSNCETVLKLIALRAKEATPGALQQIESLANSTLNAK